MLPPEKILSRFNPATGEIAGAPVVKRHLSDLRGCFADDAHSRPRSQKMIR